MTLARILSRGRRGMLTAGLAVVLAGGAAGPASAQPDRGSALDNGLRTVQDGPVTLEQAKEIARRRFDGQVVRAETQILDGREVHVIRIIQDGTRVRDVYIDAATGRSIRR